MKNKWLIILFIFFLIVILLSLLITQQSQKAISVSDKEISIAEQTENKVLPDYSSHLSQAPIASLPLAKRGITIIESPSIASEGKSISVPKIADKATNNISSQNVASSVEEQGIPQAGITKTEKQPSPKEAQEMNSSGIVMY